MWSDWLLLVVGLALLIFGAQVLVQGAANLALRLNVTPLVVGLTVVAFGTSSPELAVSVRSALEGQAALSLGNVVGSNIFNVLVVLGASALITPLAVEARLVRFDVPLMIGVSVAVLLLALDGSLSRVEGGVLVAAGIAYTALLYRQGRRGEDADVDLPVARGGIWLALLYVVLGLALLGLGARWLVDSATDLARAFGVSELIIGLTIVAAGTSLPEVATSVVASLRGERDMAVGNVVGSNVFNVLWVLGAAGLFSSSGIAIDAEVLRFDLVVMIAVAVACLPVFFSGYQIERWEGAFFLVLYVGYLAVLVASAVRDDLSADLRMALLGFGLPLSALTLAVLTWRSRAGVRPSS